MLERILRIPLPSGTLTLFDPEVMAHRRTSEPGWSQDPAALRAEADALRLLSIAPGAARVEVRMAEEDAVAPPPSARSAAVRIPGSKKGSRSVFSFGAKYAPAVLAQNPRRQRSVAIKGETPSASASSRAAASTAAGKIHRSGIMLVKAASSPNDARALPPRARACTRLPSNPAC